jgi:hypothetical protein
VLLLHSILFEIEHLPTQKVHNIIDVLRYLNIKIIEAKVLYNNTGQLLEIIDSQEQKYYMSFDFDGDVSVVKSDSLYGKIIYQKTI